MRHTIFTILTFALLAGCKKPVEPQTIAGYIADCNEEMILIKCDTTSMRLMIDNNTVVEHKELISGNVVEVIYQPQESEGELAKALEIFTDRPIPKR